ncbi:phosphotransferase [Burkholderiaceae bacterium]|nr:phosphotransferase [Burkholderiaceae bacterium]
MVNAPFPAISWPSEPRKQAFDQWFSSVCNTHQIDASSLQVASADASFRRYFRAHRLGQAAHTVIVMDSPPQSENAAPFVQVAELLAKAQLPAPDILAWDQAHGFLLLSDLGRHTLLDVLSTPNANAAIPGAPFAEPRVARVFMEEAIDLLVRWQLASEPGVLPPYDAPLLRRELMLFPEWYVAQNKGYALSETQAQVLHTSFERLIAHNLDAPQVYVHRDYMPRNLLVGPDGRLGIVDFQDAVMGPVTYDIASLMRDAFWTWDDDFVIDITIRYWERARVAGLLNHGDWANDFGSFFKAVEWMGLQRHLKILGVFARLSLRDGKPKYLADTPRFIQYARATAGRYIELKPLLRLLDAIEGE